MTIFLGCGFAAKYREGGGVFSVPLQWMLGLRRMEADAVWLEFFPGTGDERKDMLAIRSFQREVHTRSFNYCLLYQPRADDTHELGQMRCFGLTRRALLDRLSGPNTLLNLSYSIHPPFLLQFERRILCDLDPSEIFYWMTKLEMGQSTHHEFCTIGLNVGAADCRLPLAAQRKEPASIQPDSAATTRRLKWKTFFPLVDTEAVEPMPRSPGRKFTTIGQWYWGGAVEVDGQFPDLSKKVAWEKYLELPVRVPHARWELAMNIRPDDPERQRLLSLGWHLRDPHRVARTPQIYQRYLGSADAEFTAIKGVDVAWRTGWLSDRAAMFLALARPVITEETGASRYLPGGGGLHFVHDLASAALAAAEVLRDWEKQAREARALACAAFDSVKNLRKILTA